MYVVGADPVQPAAPEEGVPDVSVRRYPVTPTLSVAVNVVMLIVREEAVVGILKAVTTGRVVSTIATLERLDTFPA